MKLKTLFITVIGIFGLLVVGALTGSVIKAQAADDYPPLVQKLVDRFNLDPAEVQEVFEETRAERQSQQQARLEEKINQAVAEGKITAEQQEAILNRHAEIKEQHEALKDLSPEERRQAFQELHQEMKTWAEENGLDLQQIFPSQPRWGWKGHFGPRFGR